MSRILFASFILLSTLGYSQQDIIKKTDGSEVKVIIVELSKRNIKYKLSEKGVEENIDTELVKEVVFKNGTTKSYNNAKYSYELKPHQLNVDLFLFAIRQTLFFSYQYNLKNEGQTLLIPLVANFKNKYYSAGIDFRFNLNNSEPSRIYIGPLNLGDGMIHYFVGPSFYFTNFKENENIYNASYLKASLGVSMQLMWGLNTTVFFGAGPGYNFTNKSTLFDWNFNITFGYRFNKKTKL